jgi:tetrahydrodipicolinate N-succinyltransferase
MRSASVLQAIRIAWFRRLWSCQLAAIVLKGVSIGAGSVIVPGTVVVADVPPGATVMGNPARELSR